MESMAYLTAGLIDKYEKPELSVEAAMVKVICRFYAILIQNVMSYHRGLHQDLSL